MKRNKSGISLIVLVITIIVMIILASAVIISLSNSNIINKANEAVSASNLKQAQQLAALAWAEAYLDETITDIEGYVVGKLAEQGITDEKYNITVSDSGVNVTLKGEITLGSLITSADDYGKPVDYTVTVDGETYDKWQVLYEDETKGYVYIITDSIIETRGLAGIDPTTLTPDELKLYEEFRVGNWPKYTLTKECSSSWGVANLIREYGDYANTKDYSSYVIGAIGGPTIELIVAGLNAKGHNPQLTLTVPEPYEGYESAFGYEILGKSEGEDWDNDNLYILDDEVYWLSSQSFMDFDNVFTIGHGTIVSYDAGYDGGNNCGIRPVVCISTDIPAIATENGFSLVK